MRESTTIDLMHHTERTIGLEFENPLVRDDGTIINQSEIHQFWETLIEDGDIPDIDYLTHALVGAKTRLKNGQFESLNTDSGICNLEMSLSPRYNLYDAKGVFDEVLNKVLRAARQTRLRLLGYAIQPRPIEGNPYEYKTRKSLYTALGHLARHNGQIPITAHQVGVSLSLSEVIPATNALQALSGAIIALMANSPIFEDHVVPYRESRMLFWNITATSGRSLEEMRLLSVMPNKPFTSLADFYRYMWEAPMFLPALRDGKWIKTNKQISFMELLRGNAWEAQDLEGNRTILSPGVNDLNLATINIWNDAKPHLVFDPTTVALSDFLSAFDSERLEEYAEGKLLNCYMEFRAGSTSPKGEELALPALILGLINNLKQTCALADRYSWDEWRVLRNTSYISGMESSISGKSIIPILEELYVIATEGLQKRPYDEAWFLEPIAQRIKERKCPADKCIEVFRKDGIEGFIDYVSYKPQ